MAPSIFDITAVEAQQRDQVRHAPRVDPNFCHRPPMAPATVRHVSREHAEAVIRHVLDELGCTPS